MAYPLFSASESISGKTPKEQHLGLFDSTIEQNFYNAGNWYTIQQETSMGSDVYENIDVRITGLVTPTTGVNIEGDFKRLLFRDINHPVALGYMYQFSNNYWVVTNVDENNTMMTSVTVTRCNNFLRWIEETTGAYYQVACNLAYLINENRDYATAGSAVVVPSGMLNCIAQYNIKTNTIKPNQRFLFGNSSNWTSYRIEGGGLGNFLNSETSDNESVGFVRFSLAVDYVNQEEDDVVNGIANYNSNTYVLTLNETSISGDSGQSVQLGASVTLNEDEVERDIVWTSSDTLKATVSSTGLVTFVASGSATITCQLENNSTVSDTVSATTVGAPVDTYQVRFSPDDNYVLEGETKTWGVYLFKNNIQQGDAFGFVLNSGTVPSANYTYTEIDANSFSVLNTEMYIGDTLEVTATSGIYVGIFTITLKGAW